MTLDLNKPLPNKPLPKEYPMLHVTCLLGTTAIIKGNREGLLMLAEAITNALAYGKVEAEVYKVGGDTGKQPLPAYAEEGAFGISQKLSVY